MASGEAKYGRLADKYARKYGLDPKLFRRLITAESGWDPNAASGAGARGLTQVVPKWHPKANLSTPQGQLDYGASHLSSLLKKYGNPRDALAVYNSG
jgi:soluble lytic murein transglycosylase-like protein